MLYAFISEDVEDSLAKRQAVRDSHITRLKDLQQQGRLILAGPHPAIDNPDPGEAGFTGSLVVAEFDSLDTAQAWGKEDPYLTAGVYKSLIVKPFKHVLP